MKARFDRLRRRWDRPSSTPTQPDKEQRPHRPQPSTTSQGDGAPTQNDETDTSPKDLKDAPPKDQTGAPPKDGTDQWTAAYDEAVAQLDEETRTLVSRERRDLATLFEDLSDANDAHKKQSILRRGMERLQKPIRLFDIAVSAANPLTGLHPASSAAFGIVQSVTTLALGVCGVEERLNGQVATMLEQISIIDECDTLGQKLDSGDAIHMALVLVYKDLLAFYSAVVQVLTRKSVALAWISEQFNERLPPVMEDFRRHADHLHIHINNATSEIVKSIESLLIDNKIRQLLGSHKLEQLDRFHLDLTKKTADDACHWIVKDPVFFQWYGTESSKPLVLFGAMGCGKTITMSFLTNHVRHLNEGQIPSALVCYHYCRDDETGTSLYVYSSLIQQLMRYKPRVKVQFDSWCNESRSEGNPAPTQDPVLLARFFFDTVKSLERPSFVLLDGLDECDDASCTEMLDTFMEKSTSIAGFRFCASARYQEKIQDLLEGSLELHVPEDSMRDGVIVSHMVHKQLAFLPDEAKDLVVERLSELARGSAIWVQIAVDLLAKRKIRAPAKLRAFLRDELPESQLSDMYSKLFTQVTGDDEDNKNVLSEALEVLAITERPLTISELGWVVALRDSEADVATVEELKDYVDTKRLFEFLSPFIASIDFEAEKGRQVRLVHQSLRELIFQASPRLWAQQQISRPTSTADIGRRRSELHGKVLRDCMRYLRMKDIEGLELFSKEQDLAQMLGDMPGDVFEDDSSDVGGSSTDENDGAEEDNAELSFDPRDRGFGEFFTYASCYWLHHMRKAEHGNGPALTDVIALTTPDEEGSQNWWEQFRRPDCTLKLDESQLRPESLDPWTIVALYGSESLLQELIVSTGYGDDLERVLVEARQKRAVDAILRQGELDRIPLLIRFKPGEDLQHPMNLFARVLRDWSWKCRLLHAANGDAKDLGELGVDIDSTQGTRGFDVIFDHMEGAFDIMVEQEWGNQVLCTASSCGCLPFISRLFAAAAHNPDLKREILRSPHRDHGKSPVYHQSVGDAAWNGQGAAVALLLKQDGIEAHLRYKDVMGNNVLHKAARGSDAETFELLLSHFPEGVNEKNNEGELPLELVVFHRRPCGPQLAKLLLEAGADVRCGHTASDWHAPIRMATRYCDTEMCRILVQVGGADPMSVFHNDDNGLGFIDPLRDEGMATELRGVLAP